MSKKSILLVEDNVSMRKIIEINLKQEGYDVTVADQGEEAILKVTFEIKPDLVITDLMMPVKDGFQFVNEFRKGFEEYKNVPIIVLSAKNQKEDVLRAIKVGANDYIVKPFQREELITKVKSLLENNDEKLN